jgi:uncharacterized protein (DUF2141 family)
MRIAATVVLATILATPVAAKDLRVLVSGIEKAEGEIACLLFQEEKGFPVQADHAFTRVNYPAVEGMLTCTFPDVPPGRYAVSVIHDENGNAKVDTSMLGFAKEPWGVTNNVRPARRAPRFSEAAIWVSATQVSDYEVVVER